MNRLLLVISFVALWCVTAAAEPPKEQPETVTIPLDQIWAYEMPRTRDVRELVKPAHLSQPIGMRVGGPPSFILHQGEKIAGPGFAVLGTGEEALLATHAKAPEGEQSQNAFPFGSEITVVFFSHQFGYYVHIHQVERQGTIFRIRYRFVPHETKNLSSHFALIPVGRPAPGKYDVEIIRFPMKKQFVDAGFKPVTLEQERRVVCKSFSFTVLPKQNQ